MRVRQNASELRGGGFGRPFFLVNHRSGIKASLVNFKSPERDPQQNQHPAYRNLEAPLPCTIGASFFEPLLF